MMFVAVGTEVRRPKCSLEIVTLLATLKKAKSFFYLTIVCPPRANKEMFKDFMTDAK